MVSQVSGALFRAFCVAVLVAFPALLIPGIGPETAQVVTLLALALALVIFTEYNSACPSLIEFRDAKPYNRLRVLLLFFIVMFLTILVRMELMPTGFGMLIDALARRLGEVMDFPYSPVRLLVSALPAGLPAAHVAMVQAGAALVYCIGLLAIVCFFAAMAVGYWPQRNASFNVWINLPTFDPTAGNDIVDRLWRDARINIALGVCLPFLLPIVLRASSLLIQPVTLESPLAFVWGIACWAFVPLSLIMRGVAMARVARLIREKRREAAADDGAVPEAPNSAYS